MYQSDGTEPRTEVHINVISEEGAVLINNRTVGRFDVMVPLGLLAPLTMYTIKVYTVSPLGSSMPATIDAITLSTGMLHESEALRILV